MSIVISIQVEFITILKRIRLEKYIKQEKKNMRHA